jgi:hypothetical protein
VVMREVWGTNLGDTLVSSEMRFVQLVLFHDDFQCWSFDVWLSEFAIHSKLNLDENLDSSS